MPAAAPAGAAAPASPLPPAPPSWAPRQRAECAPHTGTRHGLPSPLRAGKERCKRTRGSVQGQVARKEEWSRRSHAAAASDGRCAVVDLKRDLCMHAGPLGVQGSNTRGTPCRQASPSHYTPPPPPKPTPAHPHTRHHHPHLPRTRQQVPDVQRGHPGLQAHGGGGHCQLGTPRLPRHGLERHHNVGAQGAAQQTGQARARSLWAQQGMRRTAWRAGQEGMLGPLRCMAGRPVLNLALPPSCRP